jgi:predicted methyltransferase
LNPVLTGESFQALAEARERGDTTLTLSVDLKRSQSVVDLENSRWRIGEQCYPYADSWDERSIYYWENDGFAVAARFTTSLIKLVPTPWGPPTFEIDGIKMIPSAEESPHENARRKVDLIRPQGKRILDCCAGLGYFADWCLRGGAAEIASFEKNADVMWLRSLNPWSPRPTPQLSLTHGDIAKAILDLPSQSFDAILHDPPRFAVAGELYSQVFYNELYRTARRKARLFHYTGAPNKLARGRDLAGEVCARLRRAGFTAEKALDGVSAVRP